MTNLEAAENALRVAGHPLRYDEIVRRALADGSLESEGKTPEATMRSQISTALIKSGASSVFVRTGPGTYALREWITGGRIAAPEKSQTDDLRVAWFPDFDSVRALLPVLEGMSRSFVTGLRAAIWEQTGTVEENVDWTEPDKWIPERLEGEYRTAAMRIWVETRHTVNPRHTAGHWSLMNAYDLLSDGANGSLEVTQSGRDFIASDDGAMVHEIDEHEGIFKLLSLIAERGTASSGDLLQPWMEYAQRVSRIKAESTGRSFLYYRLRNLSARALLTRSGFKYELIPRGLAYLQKSGLAEAGRLIPAETSTLFELVAAQRAAVRKALHDHLSEVNPYAFEHIIKQLLQEIGYTDVQVTARSNDKGVDVVAHMEVGITELREVVQVKRQRSNVIRPVLDGLRGSLHRFGAVRGTLVTLGGFTKGTVDASFEKGAAPITLIDGERLLDLLIQHGIGVRSESIKVLELDLDAFASDDSEESADESIS